MATEHTGGAAAGRRPASDTTTGARRLRGGGDTKKRGGLLWMLLGLLALLLLVWLLFSLLGGDDDDKDSAGGSANTGSLTAGGTTLLPVPSGGLTSFRGQTAEGKALEVVSVNGNEGFSVAKGDSDPLYVEWGGDVGTNEDSRFKPKVGQEVNLTGPVQRAGNNVAERLKLQPADARLVEAQGGFVNADRVVESK